jgi:hypothetical protein
MNFRAVIFLLLIVSSSVLFSSSCTSVESKNSEEVVIDSGNSRATNEQEEIVITDADLEDKNKQVSTVQEVTGEAKRLLPDESVIETLIDGFGNKTETRYFKEHPRLRLIILRTSAEGNQEVTVYGYGSDTAKIADLGDKALTASGDEIANAAQLVATRATSESPVFVKKNKTDTTLKPLPSSAFQKPLTPVNQPTETVQPETTNTTEKPPTQANEEDED